MKNVDSVSHTRGDSHYVDDFRVPSDTLAAVPFASPFAHGRIKELRLEKALGMPGVVRILTAADIPGENQIGGVVPDEELLASKVVDFIGQPVALILADTVEHACAAREEIELVVEELPIITDPRVAAEKGELIVPPVVFAHGDVSSAWKKCDTIVEGTAESGGQEHLYLETQGAVASPLESGGVHLISSTQGPTAVQTIAAKVLGLPMHRIDVEVLRLGGGFGGKEDQATAWGVLAALGAHLLQIPVKLVLHRLDDMYMTGKRHPYSSDYKIGLTAEGKILAYEVTFYQNAGASADLSPPVLSRSLFHANNSYLIPNLKATGLCCRTNLPPNTAFRGFGGPQGMFVIEAALTKAAQALGVPTSELQKKNLLRDGDEFHYGTTVKDSTAIRCWEVAEMKYDLPSLQAEVKSYNDSHHDTKRGISCMPVCFGISFTKTQMNQAGSLVHVYKDGSVAVSTAAIEMGQGVNTKLVQVAAKTLSIAPSRVKVLSTLTSRVANTFPSAASSEPDLNGKATEIACKRIVDRLCSAAAEKLGQKEASQIEIRDEWVYFAGDRTELGWQELLTYAHKQRISLSEHAHYATPNLYFDLETKKGEPFAYHVYGTAITLVTLDCLRGTYSIDAVKIVHDFGDCMNTDVDLGQMEGGLVQGIGWMTLEEVVYNDSGKLLSNSLSTYKIPDIYSVPSDIEVHFLEDSVNPLGIFNSKAIGEPPLMYGIGTYFALEDAIRAFRAGDIRCSAPMTVERTLMELYADE